MAKIQFDGRPIAEVIHGCFDKARDVTLSTDDRDRFYNEGCRLRVQFVNLVSRMVDDATPQFAEAGTRLAAVNASLQATLDSQAKVVQALADLDQLAVALDGLLKVVAPLV